MTSFEGIEVPKRKCLSCYLNGAAIINNESLGHIIWAASGDPRLDRHPLCLKLLNKLLSINADNSTASLADALSELTNKDALSTQKKAVIVQLAAKRS